MKLAFLRLDPQVARENLAMQIAVPEYALNILDRLESHGFEAFVVGGCVRDSLLGVTPGDWDVCTAATPEEMRACFSGMRVIETGLKHGTLTVRSGGQNVEVTTYRLDGPYLDHRRPESVRFVRALEMDLMRRDFTVNAMAYSPKRGLVDRFGGQEDLARRLIRCVGEPRERFEEDALRLLRALRFAARFGFDIESGTALALREKASLMAAVAAERIFAEWKKLVTAPASRQILTEYADLFARWMPGLDTSRAAMLGYWDLLPARSDLRTALLCRDPEALCAFLKTDGAFKKRVARLWECEGEPLPDSPVMVLRFLAACGEDTFSDRLDLARARGEDADMCLGHLHTAQQQGRVWRVRDMAVTGSDLTSLGFSGPALGEALNALLEAVMKGQVPNEKEALLAAAQCMKP